MGEAIIVGRGSTKTINVDGESISAELLNQDRLIEKLRNVLKVRLSGPFYFEVVGSVEEPTDPMENTIWVETDVQIPNYIFSMDIPNNEESTSITEGTAWIRYGKDGAVKANILIENEFYITPIEAFQYINGAWVSKSANTYQNGEWIPWTVYLYRKGKLYEHITGGWDNFGICLSSEYRDPLALTISYNADSVTLKSSRASGQPLGRWSPKNKIDLSGFSKVVINVLSASGGSGNLLDLSVVSAHGTYYTDYRVASLRLASKKGEVTLDISNVNSECYVCLDVYRSQSITVDEIKLIP